VLILPAVVVLTLLFPPTANCWC